MKHVAFKIGINHMTMPLIYSEWSWLEANSRVGIREFNLRTRTYCLYLRLYVSEFEEKLTC